MLSFRKIKDGGSRGFTLVELLVVIAIISVLATLLLLQLGIARAKARDAKRVADINQARSALELFFDQNGSYIASTDMSPLKPTYVQNIPKDPLASGCTNLYSGALGGAAQCYGYTWSPAVGPAKMMVWTELEQSNRNALNSDADIDSTGWSGATINGANEACTAAISDCVFDLGTN